MRHAVIMAGGSGTRLWPLSRRARPKQLMRLFDGASLLKLAANRLYDLFDPKNIWVITSGAYLDLVAAELPAIPHENLIGEPMGRDTANAIGLAAQLLALQDPAGTMAVFTADHIISPQDQFTEAIRAGLDAAEKFPSAMVTFGITADRPETGYGYVRRGAAVMAGVWRSGGFKEKPERAVAEQYVASGEYLWNSGMFAWRIPAILAELRRQLPENSEKLGRLAAEWRVSGESAERAAQFESLKKVSIDFGVMEQAREVLVVEMKCKWLDLGSWTAMATAGARDVAGNVTLGSRGFVVGGRDNVLVSETDHLLVGLGVSDLVVVHSEDATLICHRDHVQAIRDLAADRRARYGEEYE